MEQSRSAYLVSHDKLLPSHIRGNHSSMVRPPCKECVHFPTDFQAANGYCADNYNIWDDPEGNARHLPCWTGRPTRFERILQDDG
jgi:hypothetical protein